jgi:hypothetical protein
MVIRSIPAAALAIVAFFATAAVFAQEQSAPVTMPAVPQHNCVKPEPVNSLSSNNQIRTFNKVYKAYSECINKYIEDVKALSNAALAAGNKAVDEFNKLSAEIKAQNEAAKQ